MSNKLFENGEDLLVKDTNIVEKECDMGFYENYTFSKKNGIIQNNGCQRINYCSCDCNHCSMLVL